MGWLSFHISFLFPPSSIGSISLLSDHTRPVSFLSHSSVGPSVSFLSSLLMLVSFGSPVSFPSMRVFISFRIGILSWEADVILPSMANVCALVQVEPASSCSQPSMPSLSHEASIFYHSFVGVSSGRFFFFPYDSCWIIVILSVELFLSVPSLFGNFPVLLHVVHHFLQSSLPKIDTLLADTL